MILQDVDGKSFNTGSCRYHDHLSSGESGPPRIFIEVKLMGIRTFAAVDTGGVYAICNPELASLLDLSPTDGEAVSIRTWAKRYDGRLYRLTLSLIADQGDSLDLDAAVFFPDLQPDEQWPFPASAILGYSGCLERFKFAVSPTQQPESLFLFGAI